MSAVKELNFFTDLAYERGMAWYETQFAEAGDAKAIGEASPFYTSHPWQPQVPERVARHLPDVRLIYLLRHPIERMLSNYRHSVMHHLETRPVEEALLTDDWMYLHRSSYSMQTEHWLEHLPRERLLMLVAEDLRRDRAAVLRRVHEFIGVTPDQMPEQLETDLNRREDLRSERLVIDRLRQSRTMRRLAPTAVRRRLVQHPLWGRLSSTPMNEELRRLEISDDVRRELVRRLSPDLERLPAHLGHDFDCWGLLHDPLAR
jgi:hypothetical protein